MKITALMENTSVSSLFAAEHGLSFYIETADRRILIDTGASDLFIQNAERLGIDLNTVDTAILSHGHYDHGGGLPAFLSVNDHARVLLSPLAFGSYYSIHSDGPRYIGLPDGLKGNARFSYIEESQKIDDTIEVLCTAPNRFPIPDANRRLMKKKNGMLVRDTFDHEIYPVLIEGDKRVLFSGCAHRGILNILEAFCHTYQDDPYAVFSGFHMKKRSYTEEDEYEARAAAGLLYNSDTRFYTCHCTGKEMYEAMKQVMHDQLQYIHCGETVIL